MCPGQFRGSPSLLSRGERVKQPQRAVTTELHPVPMHMKRRSLRVDRPKPNLIDIRRNVSEHCLTVMGSLFVPVLPELLQ